MRISVWFGCLPARRGRVRARPLPAKTRTLKTQGCGTRENNLRGNKNVVVQRRFIRLSMSPVGRVLSFLEKQFAGALRGFHYSFDQRYAQLAFFEFEDAVDGAAGRRGHGVFQ
jgi:hypothetical protein